MPVSAVTDATFEQEVLRSELPVLIDLHADWCQPCKQLAPIVDEVSRELDGKLKVVKLDIDQNPNVTGKYAIRAVPTLIMFKNGEVAAQHTGALVQKKQLESWVNSSVTA